MTWNHISVKKDLVSKELWWLVGGGGDVKHENLVRKELMGVKLPRYFEGARIESKRSKHQCGIPEKFSHIICVILNNKSTFYYASFF